MEHLHWALVSKKIRQPEREWVQHILICPFGWLGKNIMPLLGPDGGMDRQGKKTEQEQGRFGGRGRDWEKWGLKEERMTAVRDGQRKGWSLSFLDFPLPLTVWWAPIKEASGDWALLIPVQINFWQIALSPSFFFFSARLPGREGGRDFSILVLFRLYESPKRQMKSWSLLFHDNNHLVTPHIRLNLSYTSRQINLCQPLCHSPYTLSVCISLVS